MRVTDIALTVALTLSMATLTLPSTTARADDHPTSAAVDQKAPPQKQAKIDVSGSKLLPGKLFVEYEGLPFGGDNDALTAYERLRVEKAYRPKFLATLDVHKRDLLQQESKRKVEEFSKSYMEFRGQRSGYDVSVLSGEFRHNARQSMRVRKDDKSRSYFLMSEGAFWKLIRQIPGSPAGFASLLDEMKKTYGEPAEVENRTEYRDGEPVDVVEKAIWRDGGIVLTLVDLSAVYEAYIIKWAVEKVEARVSKTAAARPVDLRKVYRTDDVLQDVMKEDDDPGLPNIVDQLLEGGSTPPKTPASTPKKR